MTPSEEYHERLRKAREEGRRRREQEPPKPEDKKPELEPFVPFASMFKLTLPIMGFTTKPRRLKCVSCGWIVTFSWYFTDPSHFDKVCPSCKITAKDFYKDKPHKELTDATR